ncbi:hypothetical protein [Nocardia mexicana]|uniref:Uncharacterized protein n=1 Tax=Nocardia mexicana TaxID=279262 RepID=A0A370H274_9NOCA|nr:hypothetical protein [Nocardia mexicana]RDI50115.1 hypothetical protein DFR68_106554 [Nocardia mexicana]
MAMIGWRRAMPGQVLLVATACAGLTLLLDLAALVGVWVGGTAVAFPGDRYRAGAELLLPWTVNSLAALVVFTALLGAAAWWVHRTRGPGLVALGMTVLPLLTAVSLLQWGLYPLMYETTCRGCDAITYQRASGPTGYPEVRAALLALTALFLVAAVVAACSPATTHRIRTAATPVNRRPSTADVAGTALTALAACAAVLAVTTALIGATARKHTYRSGFVPLPADERAVALVAAGLTAAVAAGTLWYARRLRQGRGGASMLTLAGLGSVGWSVLVTVMLISTPKGGVVPSGWWVEVDPPWVREVHGTFAWAALIALIPAVATVLWPATLRWLRNPGKA